MKKILLNLILVLLLVSTNQEQSLAQDSQWNLYKEAPTNVIPLQFSASPDGVLYMLTTDRKIFYRVNSESEWTILPGVFGWWNTLNIEVNQTTGTLYVGTLQNGVRYTSDFGETWDHEYFLTNENGFHATIWSMTSSPTGNEMFLSGSKTIYKTSDDGASWQEVLSNFVFVELYCLENGKLLGGAAIGGAFTSTDGGNSWSTAGLDGIEITRFTENAEEILYCSSYSGVFESQDLGASWSPFSEGLNSLSVLSVEYHPEEDELLCGTQLGLSILSNDEWSPANFNLEDGQVNDLISVDEKLIVGSEKQSVQFDQNEIDNWDGYNQGLTGSITDFTFVDESSTELITGYDQSPILSRNLELELNWENFHLDDISDNSCKAKRFIKNGNGDIFILDLDELFRSTDGGETFENITPDLPLPPFAGYSSFDKIAIGGNNEVLLLQGGSATTVYHSTNNGETFEELIDLSQFGPIIFPRAFTVAANGDYYILFENNINSETRLITSTDGSTWTDVDITEIVEEFSSLHGRLEVFDDQRLLFSVKQDIYFLDVASNEFTSLNVPWDYSNPNVYFEIFSFNGEEVYVIAYPTFSTLDYEGVWRTTDEGENWSNLSFPTSDDESVLLPKNVRLSPQGIPVVNSLSDGLYYYGEPGIFTGIAEYEDNAIDLSVFPNPVRSNSVVTVQGLENFDNPTFSLMDNLGRKVSIDASQTNSNQAVIQIPNVGRGVYYLLVNEEETRLGSTRLMIVD